MEEVEHAADDGHLTLVAAFVRDAMQHGSDAEAVAKAMVSFWQEREAAEDLRERGSLPAPQTPAEAAQLIADALNAVIRAGFDPYWDQDEGGITCSRRVEGSFEHAHIRESHEGVWRLRD